MYTYVCVCVCIQKYSAKISKNNNRIIVVCESSDHKRTFKKTIGKRMARKNFLIYYCKTKGKITEGQYL